MSKIKNVKYLLNYKTTDKEDKRFKYISSIYDKLKKENPEETRMLILKDMATIKAYWSDRGKVKAVINIDTDIVKTRLYDIKNPNVTLDEQLDVNQKLKTLTDGYIAFYSPYAKPILENIDLLIVGILLSVSGSSNLSKTCQEILKDIVRLSTDKDILLKGKRFLDNLYKSNNLLIGIVRYLVLFTLTLPTNIKSLFIKVESTVDALDRLFSLFAKFVKVFVIAGAIFLLCVLYFSGWNTAFYMIQSLFYGFQDIGNALRNYVHLPALLTGWNIALYTPTVVNYGMQSIFTSNPIVPPENLTSFQHAILLNDMFKDIPVDTMEKYVKELELTNEEIEKINVAAEIDSTEILPLEKVKIEPFNLLYAYRDTTNKFLKDADENLSNLLKINVGSYKPNFLFNVLFKKRKRSVDDIDNPKSRY